MATQQWPDRKNELIPVTIFVTILSSSIALWRLAVRFRINPRLGPSDYWMIAAVPMAIAGHTFNILGAYAGEGRLDADPFLTYEQRKKAQMFTFFARCFNMYAMFLAKMSICAYLLALGFSRAYKIVIWISVAIVVTCGFLLPFISHWTQCTPLVSRWDPKIKGECWAPDFKVINAYLQVSTNVATDLVYAAAPIIYLRRVKLSRYTQWGVRGVFACALLGTGLSIAKLVEFNRSNGKKNGLYIATSSSILSACENSMAIIVACLPPLRRTFDNLLQKILPESILSAIGATQERSQNNQLTTYYSNNTRGGTAKGIGDDESELAILPDAEYIEDSNGRIIRTTTVKVTSKASEECRDGKKGPSTPT